MTEEEYTIRAIFVFADKYNLPHPNEEQLTKLKELIANTERPSTGEDVLDARQHAYSVGEKLGWEPSWMDAPDGQRLIFHKYDLNKLI